MRCRVAAVTCALTALAGPVGVSSAAGLELTRVPDAGVAFNRPVNVAFAPGDTSRVFVVERAGRVWLVKDGVLLAAPFLDISSEVESGITSDNALESLAFAPDYATTGRFYAFFTDRSLCDPGTIHCDNRVVEFHRSAADPDVADPTERTILTLPHVGRIHHGGALAFGPDGRLWVSTGDSAVPTDAQEPGSLAGKILRVDPSAANPQPEIVAMGLRNPYRFAFDPDGNLIVGDVGEDVREELDILPAGVTGANFGWPVCEGTKKHLADEPCPDSPVPNYVAPLTDYEHLSGTCNAITSGFAVRDLALPGLTGRILYGDYCRGFVRALLPATSGAGDEVDLGVSVIELTAIVEGADCAPYLVSLQGPIYRLDPVDGVPAHQCPPPPPPIPAAGPPAPGANVPGGAPDLAPPPASVRALDTTPPRLYGVQLSPSRFAVGSPRIGRFRPPHGATLRFGLSEAATVTILAYRWTSGHPRWRLVGTLSRRLGLGAKSLPFSGDVGGRPLGPGSYRATLLARDDAGNRSAGVQVSFAILAR